MENLKKYKMGIVCSGLPSFYFCLNIGIINEK